MNPLFLDLTSTTQGLLVPRMTSTQRKAISSPANGLEVFDNTLDSFYFYNGSKWVNFSGAGSGSASQWTTSGSNIYNNNSGYVGIGKSNPHHGLDAKNGVNTDSAYFIGGTEVLSAPGTANLFAGTGAGASNSGNNNYIFGTNAGYNNGNGGTANYNYINGYQSGYNNAAYPAILPIIIYSTATRPDIIMRILMVFTRKIP